MSRGAETWDERVAAARDRLVRAGHVDPVVAVSTPTGRFAAGDVGQRFEVGSVTKVFTGLLLAVLAEASVVSPADRVPDLLPPGTALAPGVAGITLQSLACHRSGLPRLPPGIPMLSLSRSAMADPYAAIDADRLIASLARTKVRGTPGDTAVRYSNYGMGLLGYLLGRAGGTTFEDALAQRVLAPLSMTRSDFTDHDLHQGRSRGRPAGPWHLAALAGAGGLRSPAADLLTFLECVRSGGGALESAVAATLRPQGRRGPATVGLGWWMLGEGELLMHDGGTLAARSEIRLERRTGTAVVVLGDGRRGTAKAASALLAPMPRRRGRA